MKKTKLTWGKSGIAFFEGSSWGFRYKERLEDGSTKYGKVKGYATEQDAVKDYYIYEEKFKEKSREYEVSINKDIMFVDYLIYWFENIYSERIETTTKMVSSYIIYNLIVPSIEYNLKINLVTTDYLDDIIKRASNLTESGGYSARMIIIMAMKDALIGGYISHNPSLDTKQYRRKKTKIRVYTKRQLKRFLTASQSSNWYLEILLGLFCGLRKGEIMGLKFSDFDMENRTVKVERQIAKEYELEKNTSKITKCSLVEKNPKTPESIRTLKVPDIIIEELEKRNEKVNLDKAIYKNKYIDNNYISCTEIGVVHSQSSLNARIIKICRQLSLPDLTVHGLRHMCATILLESGASLAKIQAFLGHRSIHTTFEYYCEVMDEKDKILAFMNNIFAIEDGDTKC